MEETKGTKLGLALKVQDFIEAVAKDPVKHLFYFSLIMIFAKGVFGLTAVSLTVFSGLFNSELAGFIAKHLFAFIVPLFAIMLIQKSSSSLKQFIVTALAVIGALVVFSL